MSQQTGSTPAFLSDWRKTVPSAALIALLIVVWYVGAQALSRHYLGVSPSPSARTHDVLAHLALAGILFAMARNLTRFAITTIALLSAFTFANAMKIAVLGAPIMPDDFIAARNLFLLLEGWQLWASVAVVVLPVALFAWMFAWRQPRAWAALGLVVIAAAQVGAHAQALERYLDERFGDWVWNQRGNFEARGLPVHLLQESARNLARRGAPPDMLNVALALQTVGERPSNPFIRTAMPGVAQRNLHVIVLESFWDPRPLKSARFSSDPIDPAFRKLWAATGQSRALSPVFGGYTANAEFEVLCGFPVTQDAVFFEGRLRRDVPCLPGHLATAGYRTHASHPNAASFWNRVNAYRRIGFEHYWSERDFEMDDVNREFLSDESLYRQVLERIGPALDGPDPVFNYVLTYFGHLDYPLNERRPRVIEAPGGREYAEAYANTVYYKSRELMAFLKTLRKRDPQAVIVVFGDHLPFLGMNHANYTDSGLLAESRAEFTDEMFRTLVATPLIVIDGKRGPLKLGDVPLYQVPALILDLLGDSRDTLLTLTATQANTSRIRPLPGITLQSLGKKVSTCRGNDALDHIDCVASTAWLDAIKVLKMDLFSGHQFALHRTAPLGDPITTTALDDELEHLPPAPQD
ncbi:MAG TPA: LTA synthase family protein [Rhodocyclaceae bacterium]|nr:LTA synthase family protein [Rhodocyclaceae bacterium]